MAILPVHYDCDTGQDDAVALLYALGSAVLDIQSITAACGNVDVYQSARNTLQILDVAERQDIPVYVGAEKPLERELISLPEVFGVTGMAGAEDWPQPKRQAFPLHRNQLKELSRGKVIIATAPLTNIAMQIIDDPDFAGSIPHLIVMGGCVYPEPVHKKMGNFRPRGANDYAEYNFACDPEAAKIVFTAGIPKITLIGLNVTRAALYNGDVEKCLLTIGNNAAKAACQILSAVGQEDIEDYENLRKYPSDPVRAMHDVLAMACVDRPDLFEFEELPIHIVDGAPSAPAGQSVIDAAKPDHPSVKVATNINYAEFIDQMIQNISRLP